MAHDLNAIYNRTSGYCHICHRKVYFNNYGVLGARGAWEIEHSRPQALGGTHHGNNKYAACIPCNREKSHRYSTRTMRARNGLSRAPLSFKKRREAKQTQALAGAALFGTRAMRSDRSVRSSVSRWALPLVGVRTRIDASHISYSRVLSKRRHLLPETPAVVHLPRNGRAAGLKRFPPFSPSSAFLETRTLEF
jgi:hypothetical protein